MNGVEILSQEPMVDWGDIGIICVSLVIIGFSFFIGYLFNTNWKKVLIIDVLMILFFIWFINVKAIHYTGYKVTVSDSVTFNEFNERYEILNQDGKIYTVKERE